MIPISLFIQFFFYVFPNEYPSLLVVRKFEDELGPPDQVVIFKGDFACLQAINVTAFTAGDLVSMVRSKLLPGWLSPRQMVITWNILICNDN